MSDRSAQSIASAKNALALGNAKQDIKSVSGAMARVGARVDSQNNKKIYVYCYNPKVPYSSNFGDAYYVNTGYANCNGLAYPVYINGNYAQFDFSGVSIRGTWAVMIQKIPNSEVWGVNVLFPSPDSNDVMVWTDKDGNTVNLDADAWVVGSFVLDIGTDIGVSNSIMGLYMHHEALTPASFLKNRFMQIIGDASGSDTDDFTSWANAMGCDAIFKRLAALEIFVNNFYANYVTIGGFNAGAGFRFRAHKDGGPNNRPIFDVYYGETNKVFEIDTSNGDIYFGNGFHYNATTKKVTMPNADITEDSKFSGNFDCRVIKTNPQSETETSSTATIQQFQAATYVTYFLNAGLSQNTFYKCKLGDNETIRYLKFSQYTSGTPTLTISKIYFYDSDFQTLDLRTLYPDDCKYYQLPDGSGSPYSYLYCQTVSTTMISTYLDISNLTLTIFTGGNNLELAVPDDIIAANSLRRGQVYYDHTTGALYISLNTGSDPS